MPVQDTTVMAVASTQLDQLEEIETDLLLEGVYRQLLADSGRKNRSREWYRFREAMLGEWSV